MRRHTLLPSLLLCLLAPAASALSLSEPEIRYRLGQPLTLRVDVSSNANAGEPPRVRMAAPAEFARVGLEYPVDAGGFSVEETLLPNQVHRVTLRARRLLREPIVFLLLDVQEGNTRLFKEVAAVLEGVGEETSEAPLPAAAEAPPEVAMSPGLPGAPLSQSPIAYYSGVPEPRSRQLPPQAQSIAPPRPSRLRTEAPLEAASPDSWGALQRFQLSSRLDSLRVLPDALRPATPVTPAAPPKAAVVASPTAAADNPAVDTPDAAGIEAGPLPAPTRGGFARSTWLILGLLVGVAVGVFVYARRLRTAGMSELNQGGHG